MATSYAQRFDGKLQGMLHWPQFDALWSTLRAAPEGWYLVEQGQALPRQPLTAREFLERLAALGALLRKEHGKSYCGIVYADDTAAPELVKVYDPRTLGSMCSCSSEPTPPRWVFTRLQPWPQPSSVDAAARRPWWKAWLGSTTKGSNL